MHTFFIVILVLTSVVALTFIVERALALRWNRVIPAAIGNGISFYKGAADLPRLRALCEENPSTAARLLVFASHYLDWSRGEASELIQTRARHEVAQLERGLVVLEIIVGIAPLLGLVGTIYGLITLFGSMSAVTGVDSVKFAQGISTALYATLLGLLVAIPALISWSYYSKKVENLTVELESLVDEFLRKHYHGKNSAIRRLHPRPPRRHEFLPGQTPTRSFGHHRIADRRVAGRAHLPDGHDGIQGYASIQAHVAGDFTKSATIRSERQSAADRDDHDERAKFLSGENRGDS